MNTIQQLDELAAIPPQDMRMSAAARLENYGRTAARLAHGGASDTDRSEYELYPAQIAEKGKGKGKDREWRPSS